LVTALQDRALKWYIKYCIDNPLASLVDINAALNKEFINPKSDSQSVIGFKEITMMAGETPWELNQRMKHVIHEANMQLRDG